MTAQVFNAIKAGLDEARDHLDRQQFAKASRATVAARAKAFRLSLRRWLRRYADAVMPTALDSRGVAKASALDALHEELAKLLYNFGLRQAQESSRQFSRVMAPAQSFRDVWTDKVVRMKVEQIATSTQVQVRESVRQLIAESMDEIPRPSIGEIARRLRTQWHSSDDPPYAVSSERAELIARTELAQAENTGLVLGAEASGATHIEWVAFTDGRSGDRHHEEMDGERITVEDARSDDPSRWFETPLGNRLRYPGDPNGPIKETANCRCSARPAYED